MFRFILSFSVFILFNTIVIAQDAVYSLDFLSNWNSTTHPTNYPNTAHWSTLTGTTHNNSVTFWELGQLATEGAEEIAENGNADPLTNEINTEIANGNAYEVISLPLGFGQIFSFESINVDFDFPYISLMTMLAPSPDWLAEVHNIKLTDDLGNWKTSISIEVYTTDAGTDNGTTYISEDSDTNPAQNISSLQNTFPFSDQIIATFVFTLSQVLSVENVELENAISIYPNPCRGEIFISNSSNSVLENAEIYTITGKKIMVFNNISTRKSLDVTSIKSGLYFLKLNSDKGSITKKIVFI